LNKETSYQLHIKTPLDQEELLGEPSLQSKRRKNKKDPRTLVSLEATKLKSKVN